MRVLFILKYREQPYGLDPCDWAYSGTGKPLSSGLFNSANMVVTMLNRRGYEAAIVHVRDGNDIHRECVKFKPDVAVIEAFWCPPYKFDDLYKVLPNLKFVVRNHSETPFLANEGIAFGWTLEYAAKPNVWIAPNSPRMLDDTRAIFRAAGISASKLLYLPNWYDLSKTKPSGRNYFRKREGVIDVGCFGAIRPLKNHMLQSVAAVKYADDRGLKLRFHVNGNRIEGKGDPILKNLRQSFEHYEKHELVEHDWTDAKAFKEMIASMDVVTQVSFSETFNIVAADATDAGVPVIGSREIPWLASCVAADPTSRVDISEKLKTALGFRGKFITAANRKNIAKYDWDSESWWDKGLRYLTK